MKGAATKRRTCLIALLVVQNNSACIAAASARVARSIVNYVTGARKRSQQRDNLKNEEQRAQWDRFQITQRIR
jgi:hypothetical protein